MKYGFHIKVSNEDSPLAGHFSPDTQKKVIGLVHEAKVSSLKKGIGLSNPNIRVGYDGEDFANNLYTIAITFFGNKIPRFVASHRINQLRNSYKK